MQIAMPSLFSFEVFETLGYYKHISYTPVPHRNKDVQATGSCRIKNYFG